MQFLKSNIPVILLILFEIAVGILLLTNPEGFTRAIIVGIGVVLLALGAVYLGRYIYERSRYGHASAFLLALAIPALLLGCVCAFLTDWVLGLFALVAVLCGVMLLVSGVFKIMAYVDAKKFGLPVSVLVLISAALSAILGVVIVLNPFATVKYLWVFAGVALLCEAAVDLLAVALSARMLRGR